ncbi:hypothetical protein [Fuscovulum ytuae]|uniref:PH domain-containing protein n=1 Tax=Fuscovulum ytuae TaxID=3042299 RepID=A0ABY8Q680_9RHOB|nr:hypothetical protein [Fuscovulum sp. YMD61]WGV15780.1 hypothetical protein QF092_16220 [Fuscovulum sp. YMD61]
MTAPTPQEGIDVTGILDPGETLLWQGPLGFNHASAPPTVAALFLLAFYAFWETWITRSVVEFCPAETAGQGCAGFYWLVGPLLLAIALVQGFALMERQAITTGRAHGALLLTDKRLIRLSHWPWRRMKTGNYLQTPPSGGMPGVIRFGPLGSMIVGPDAGMLIHRMRAVKAGKA